MFSILSHYKTKRPLFLFMHIRKCVEEQKFVSTASDDSYGKNVLAPIYVSFHLGLLNTPVVNGLKVSEIWHSFHYMQDRYG